MQIRAGVILLTVLAFSVVSSSQLSSQSGGGIRVIEIKSAWGGLGPSANSELRIVKEGSEFRLGRTKISSDALNTLLAALEQPDIPSPSLPNLGIDQEWLEKNSLRLPYSTMGGPEIGASDQQVLYRQSFHDQAFMTRIVSGIFSSFHTDDYPSVKAIVSLEDGSVIMLTSDSQHPFMLPWKIEMGGTAHQTFNADISRSLAAILPNKTANRSRLLGEELPDLVRIDAERALEPQLKMLDAKNRASAALSQLEQRYAVLDADIDAFHRPEYGTEWNGKQAHETNLHATLKKAEFPPNLFDALVLEYKNGNAVGTDHFLSSMGGYEDLLLSESWLMEYIRSHPKVLVRISYVHDASFGAKALQVFTNDMHAVGKDALVSAVNAQQTEIALLIVGNEYTESYWLLFPDGHMILWRYGGPSGLLKWAPADFHTSHCSDYQGLSGGCVGAIVSSYGLLSE